MLQFTLKVIYIYIYFVSSFSIQLSLHPLYLTPPPPPPSTLPSPLAASLPQAPFAHPPYG